MKFSIVVPVFNGAAYLEHCVASVRSQAGSAWELILVDDGSTDGSGGIVDRFAAEDPRIRALHQANSGQFFARQQGIRAAAGDYLLFLDCDDALEPDCLSVLSEVLSADEWDMVFYTGIVDRNGSCQSMGLLWPERREIPVDWIKKKLISSHDINSLCTKAIRRTLFDGDGEDYSCFAGICCGEDKARLFYPVSGARRVLYLPDALYRYYDHAQSVVHSFALQTLDRRLANDVFDLLYRYMQRWDLDGAAQREAVAVYYLKNALSVYYGMRKNCRTPEERKAFRSYPWSRKVDRRAFRYVFSRSLTTKDRLKILAAAMGL